MQGHGLWSPRSPSGGKRCLKSRNALFFGQTPEVPLPVLQPSFLLLGLAAVNLV